MHEPTPGLIAILRKYMRDPAATVGSTTTLAELGIDRLDLPLIGLDIEDAYDFAIGQVDDEIETVGALAAHLSARLATRAMPRPRVQRRRSTWLSTGTERSR